MDKCEDYELVCYNTDNSRINGRASQVFSPENVADVKKLIFDFQDIIPRGNGSNVVGGCVPSDSVILDMKKINRIDFDFKSKNVYVGAGVTIKELNEKLKSIGYEFPIFGEGTIGGMIAMNAPSLMGKYGNIREWINEIEFVNGHTEFLKIGKSDFGEVCGMEGITGIIVGAKLKLIPYIERSASIFQSSNIGEIISTAKKLKSLDNIAMIRFYSPYLSKLLGFPEKYHIIIIFNNDKGKITGEEYKKLFDKIRKDYHIFYKDGYRESEDPKFLFEKIKDFVLFLDKFKVPCAGDFIQGIVYTYFNSDIKKQEVAKIVNRMNGVPGKYGIGIKRKKMVDDFQKRIIKRVKLRHDPFLKLNRGKYIDIFEMEEYKNLMIGNENKNFVDEVENFIEEVEIENSRNENFYQENPKNDVPPHLKRCGLNDTRFLDARESPHSKECGDSRHNKNKDRVFSDSDKSVIDKILFKKEFKSEDKNG